MAAAAVTSPLIEEVLGRYPQVDRTSLNFPADAMEWTEKEVDMFVYSGGFMKPKKKKAAAAAGGPVTPPVATPALAAPAVPLRALPPLEKSAWWVNNANPNATLRLFCGMGIGNVGSTYGSWISKEIADKYPQLEVCVVEFPGHGTNMSGPPLETLEAAADALATEIRRCHFAADGTPRSYALFGFSMGANIMYLVSQRLPGCRKLYLAGRGPPHLPAPVRDVQAPQVAKLREANREGNEEAIVSTLEVDVLPIFMAQAQVSSYARIFRTRLSREQGRQELRRFAASLAGDCAIGMEANEVPRDYVGDLAFFYSAADETWPLNVDGQYEDFANLWKGYCRNGTFTTEEVAPISHGELGAFGSPIFQKVCNDLQDLVSKS